MKYIDSFPRFLLSEKLHIHEDMDKLSDYVYNYIKNKSIGIYEIENNISELNIKSIIINIADLHTNQGGELDIDKSNLTKDGWIFYFKIKIGCALSTIKHEMDHALRLMLQPKEDILNKLNYLKSSYILDRTKEIEYFFYMIYLSSMDEINAMVKEAHGDIKEEMIKKNLIKLNKEQFIYFIKTSRPYAKSLDMINFKIKECFKGFSENNLNKLFYLYEENKTELDNINKFSKFIRNIKLIIQSFKVIFHNKITFLDEPDKIYKPNRNGNYYENWINNQGKKLQKTLFKLYDHYI